MAEPTIPFTSPRGVTIAVLVLAGAIHLLVASQRSVVWAWEAAGLAAAGVVQLGCAVALLVDRRRVWWWVTSATGTLVAVAWLWTRAIGYPFGPQAGSTPQIGWVEVTAVGSGLVAASIAGAVLLSHDRAGGVIGPRFENLALACLAAAAIPGIAAGSWLEEYASVITDDGTVVGVGHDHGSTASGSTLSAGERVALGSELTAARAAALLHPTLAEAEAAGLVAVGEPVAGVGVQAFDTRVDLGAPIDESRPRAWIYANASPDAPVVGVLYDTVGGEAPDGFTGSSDAWHLHPGACEVPVPGTQGGALAVPVDTMTGDDCELVGGTHTDKAHWMLRAWVVAGWENPAGTFAHDHPDLPTS